MADDVLTTEQVAELAGMTVPAVYASRQRSQYPGRLGFRRGKRLLYKRADIESWLIQRDLPNSTNDPTTALLWALEGIQKTLQGMHKTLLRVLVELEREPWGYTTTVEDTTTSEEEE